MNHLRLKLNTIAAIGLVTLNACGPVSPEQKAKLIRDSEHNTTTQTHSSASVANVHIDTTGTTDLAYSITSGGGVYSISVTRHNQITVDLRVVLGPSSVDLYTFLDKIFADTSVITSRASCSATTCTTRDIIIVNRTDASSNTYSFPLFSGTTLPDPIKSLNTYIVSQI